MTHFHLFPKYPNYYININGDIHHLINNNFKLLKQTTRKDYYKVVNFKINTSVEDNYPIYKPHISLSYNIPKSFDHTTLQLPNIIYFTNLYIEDLDD
jgi:hypothetical protein